MKKQIVMVVAVHPDDETLGCGGTLLKHKANGDEIHWLICTESNTQSEFFKIREKEINVVADHYKFDSVHNIHLKSMQVDEYSMTELITKISQVIKEVQPNVVYLPFNNDVHSDHRKIFEAAYSCTKSFRYPFVEKIYMMETLSETEFAVSNPSLSFVPNVFVDISGFMEKKLEIMSCFDSEIAPHPFPRSMQSIKALANYRGSTMGCEFAEAFMLIKEVVR